MADARTAPSDGEATIRALAERLLERVRLLDHVIVEHHSASAMRPRSHECPVCVALGSGFFYDTSFLIERADNLLAAHRATDPMAGASVPAVDPSRSTPTTEP